MRALFISILRNSKSYVRLCHIKQIQVSSCSLSQGSYFRNKSMDSTTTNISEQITPIFLGKPDRFGGVTVVSNEEPCCPTVFSSKLNDSLKYWSENLKRTIWFKVDLNHSEWVPLLAKNGFSYHHAKKDFVMMYKWLPTEPCNIPPFAHTMIGVGALVINEQNQVLVVKEKNFNLPNWKLPGGYVEPGEDFVQTAIREVKEETNIDAEYVSMLALRHAHNAQFGCSDLYIVLHLKPLHTNSVKQAQEIAELQWMDIPEYLSHSNVHDLNRMFMEKYLFYKENEIKIECKHGIHQIMKKPYNVFHVVKDKL